MIRLKQLFTISTIFLIQSIKFQAREHIIHLIAKARPFHFHNSVLRHLICPFFYLSSFDKHPQSKIYNFTLFLLFNQNKSPIFCNIQRTWRDQDSLLMYVCVCVLGFSCVIVCIVESDLCSEICLGRFFSPLIGNVFAPFVRTQSAFHNDCFFWSYNVTHRFDPVFFVRLNFPSGMLFNPNSTVSLQECCTMLFAGNSKSRLESFFRTNW